ncbi:MAG: hypothetical protein ACK5T6_14500, partial [Pirellula sp.]
SLSPPTPAVVVDEATSPDLLARICRESLIRLEAHFLPRKWPRSLVHYIVNQFEFSSEREKIF